MLVPSSRFLESPHVRPTAVFRSLQAVNVIAPGNDDVLVGKKRRAPGPGAATWLPLHKTGRVSGIPAAVCSKTGIL